MKGNQLRVTAIGMMMLTWNCLAGELQIRAVSLASGYPDDDVFVMDAEGKERAVEIEVKTFLNHEFQSIKFKSHSLVFTTDEDHESMEDEEEFLGKVEIPANLVSAVLLFSPGLKDLAPSVKLTDDSIKAFPPGSTKVINLGSEPIRIELEGKNFDFEKESETIIKDQPVNDRNSSAMRAFRMKDGKWVQFKVGSWPHPGKKRVIRVISINPITKQPEIKGLRDIADPTK